MYWDLKIRKIRVCRRDDYQRPFCPDRSRPVRLALVVTNSSPKQRQLVPEPSRTNQSPQPEPLQPKVSMAPVAPTGHRRRRLGRLTDFKHLLFFLLVFFFSVSLFLFFSLHLLLLPSRPTILFKPKALYSEWTSKNRL